MWKSQLQDLLIIKKLFKSIIEKAKSKKDK